MKEGIDARARKLWQVLAVLAVMCLAAALRLVGLRWGLPNELHHYSYHPDEFLLVGSALFVLAQSAIPRFFNYPSLYIYLVAFAVLLGIGWGVISTPVDAAGSEVYLTARVISALMGIGAVAATYWAGAALFDRAAGLVAAIVLAVAPLHVQHSHFATVDVPSTLFIALCLGYMGLAVRRDFTRDWLASAVMAGFAAGTKYNAALVFVAPLVAQCLGHKPAVRSILSSRFWAMLGCAAAAFLVTTPGVIFNTSDFLHGVGSELRHSAEGHGLVFAATGSGLLYAVTVSLWHGLGRTIVGWLVVASGLAVIKRNKPALLILAFCIPYFALVSVSHVRFARYTLPLFPAAALLVGWLAVEFWRVLGRSRSSGLRWAWAAVFCVSIALTLLNTLALDRLFVLDDPRDRAAEWIAANIQPGASLGVVEMPWFYSPPFTPNTGFGTLPQRQEALSAVSYKITVFADSGQEADWALADPPTWVVLSDYETDDAARVAAAKGVSGSLAAAAHKIMKDVAAVDRLYARQKVFANELRIWRFRVGDTRDLPHDMRYPCPTITVYKLK